MEHGLDLRRAFAHFDRNGNGRISIGELMDILRDDLKIEAGRRELRGEDQRQELSVAGSPRYMAPEVIRREPYGVAVDTYSLGLLLWETITARKAFEGWPFARLAAHANGTRRGAKS